MRHKNFVRTITLFSVAALFLALHCAAQDPQEPSVAEAARRSRAQQKATAKPATIVTNDTLKPAPPGEAPAQAESGQPAEAGTAPAASAQAGAAPSTDEQAKKRKEIDSLKQQIADKQHGVDLQQRELALENESFYSKPDFSSDKAGKAKLDTMKDDLKQAQDELAKLKEKLASLAPEEAAKTAPAKP